MDIKILKISDIKKCPMAIFLPAHYRADGSCRCDEDRCEQENCHGLKYKTEIYCQYHCNMNYGEDYDK
jgi:hypothetical protein